MIPNIFRVLVLGGGGPLGAFLAAVVYTLLGNGQLALESYFTFIVGTSTGGLAAAMISRKGIVAYFKLWLTITTNKIYESKDLISFLPVNAFFDAIAGSWSGLMNDKPLAQMIDETILIGDLPKVDYAVCAVDMNSGQTYYATERTNGNVEVYNDNTKTTYVYTDRAIGFAIIKKFILGTASTQGAVDSVPVDLKGGYCLMGAEPTPDLTLQLGDGGPSRLVPVDFGLEKGPRECVIISLTNPIQPYKGDKNLEGTVLQSINVALYGQWDLAMKLAEKYQSETCNVVRYQIPMPDSINVNTEQFDPKVSALLETDGTVAKPVFGAFLT